MFPTIFKYELKYWFKNPSIYIYALVFLLLAIGMMAGTAGFFDEEALPAARIANSPMSIFSLMNFFNKLVLFLLPAIIGNSIYRDFKSNAHIVLYSYPFTKTDYLFGKFLSAFLIAWLIALMVGIGFFIGTQLPGVDGSALAPFDFKVYLQIYAVYLLPNMFLFGVVVFAIVTFSRNINAGFIAVVLLLIAREAIAGLTSGVDSGWSALLLEPFGEAATNYYTQNRTLPEQNELSIPWGAAMIYNRLLWLSLAVAVWGIVGKWFSFSQNAVAFSLKTGSAERMMKDNFGSIIKVRLPKVNHRFTVLQQLKISWKLSSVDFKYIITSGSFISILLAGSVFVSILLLQMNSPYDTRILPVTWVMLAFPVLFFSLLINFMTFLYAGVLIHRAKISRAHELVDVTPVPNWTLLLAKFIALVKMQALLLSIIMIAGIGVQAYNGYYHFEVGHYLFDLYGIHLIGFVIWAFAAVFVQTVFANSYLGLFSLILGTLGIGELPQLGVEPLIYRFNQNPESGFFLKYSDLSGYGHALIPYFTYKAYWGLFGLSLFFGTLLFWSRGLTQSFKERLAVAKSRLRSRATLALVASLTLFLSMGWGISREESTSKKALTELETEKVAAAADKKYAKYAGVLQPRVISVNVNMDIFPGSLSFKSNGVYRLRNKSRQIIDTLLVNYAFAVNTKYRFDRATTLISRDTIAHFDIHLLNEGLPPGDSLCLYFAVENLPNSLLHKNSIVEKNGSFITSIIYPGLGYRLYHVNAHPTDSSALRNHYRSSDSDFIDFAATVSTSEDQMAVAPGYLQKEWCENGRRYFHYKSSGKVTNDYVFNSGRYEVKREQYNGINLEIYYHQDHEYNLDHLLRGMKAALAYNEKYFSPYQHQQARIIEYSRTQGNFAQSFANTVPYSETGFMMDIDDTKGGGLNLPFLGAAHELTHQWWGHQVIPAEVLGLRMITESMAEYVSLKVLEQEYGKVKARAFLRKALDIYLRRRTNDHDGEKPLMYNIGLSKSYIPYQKGALVLYAMSDYIGEEKFNAALKAYLEKARFQEPPYTTSIEMVDYLRQATPDSLRYLIKDLFETVTFYKTIIAEAKTTPLDNGKYQVEIEFTTSKYRVDEKGAKIYEDERGSSLSHQSDELKTPIFSLPLADYIEIGVFGKNNTDGKEEEIELYLMKHKVTQRHNKIKMIVDRKPVQVGVDPYGKLIDTNSRDNRKEI